MPDEDAEDLLIAAEDGDADQILELLEKGVAPDFQDDEGETALHFACRYDKSYVTQVLLEAGASFTIANKHGLLPIHYASQTGKRESVRLLLDAGCEPDILDGEGHTPLMVACEKGRGPCLELLIEAGADLTAKTAKGQTIKSLALSAKKQEIAIRLDIAATEEQSKEARRQRWQAEQRTAWGRQVERRRLEIANAKVLAESNARALAEKSKELSQKAAESEARQKAHAFGLLTPLVELRLDTDDLLARATAWCEENGCHAGAADLRAKGLVGAFVGALELRTIPSNNLRLALDPGGGDGAAGRGAAEGGSAREADDERPAPPKVLTRQISFAHLSGDAYEQACAREVHHVLDAEDLYEVLGLPRDCKKADIKKAFLQLSVTIHPDRNTHPKASDAFQRVNEAKSTLLDPTDRTRYDAELLATRGAGERGTRGGMEEGTPIWADLRGKLVSWSDQCTRSMYRATVCLPPAAQQCLRGGR